MYLAYCQHCNLQGARQTISVMFLPTTFLLVVVEMKYIALYRVFHDFRE